MSIFTSIKHSLANTAPVTYVSSSTNPHKAQAEARADFVKTINEAVERRKEFYLTKAKLEGVGIVHVFDKDDPKGGMTIAFKKCNTYKSGVMVDIAVNTCSDDDTFSKSHGTIGALEKFFEGKVVSLPLLRYVHERELPGTVKQLFKSVHNWF